MQRSSRSRSDWQKWFFLFRALQEKVHLDVSHFEKLLSAHAYFLARGAEECHENAR